MNALSSSEQFGFVCFLAKTKEAEGKRERERGKDRRHVCASDPKQIQQQQKRETKTEQVSEIDIHLKSISGLGGQ